MRSLASLVRFRTFFRFTSKRAIIWSSVAKKAQFRKITPQGKLAFSVLLHVVFCSSPALSPSLRCVLRASLLGKRFCHCSFGKSDLIALQLILFVVAHFMDCLTYCAPRRISARYALNLPRSVALRAYVV